METPRTVPKFTKSEYEDFNRRMDSVESILDSFRLPDPPCDDPCFDPCYSPSAPPERIPVGCCDDPWETPEVEGDFMNDFESVIMTDTDGNFMSPFS